MNRLSFTTAKRVHKQSFVPKDLYNSEFVFLRNDMVEKLLFPNYTGSHKVLDKTNTTKLK